MRTGKLSVVITCRVFVSGSFQVNCQLDEGSRPSGEEPETRNEQERHVAHLGASVIMNTNELVYFRTLVITLITTVFKEKFEKRRKAFLFLNKFYGSERLELSHLRNFN